MKEMKDSEIGRIPVNWKVTKLKYLMKFGKGLSITKANLQEDGIPVISYGQIHSKENPGNKIVPSLIRYVSESYLLTNEHELAETGGFLFADTSEDYDGIGNCVYVDSKNPIFAGYHTINLSRPNISYPKYLAYLFLTDAWRKQLRAEATGIKVFSLTQRMLKNAIAVVPDDLSQKKIINYLDKKCSEIDALTADIQSQIETLEQYKRSVITEAVTRGLDKNAEMKDSGVEWIGKIPKSWSTIRIGRIFSLRNEKNDLPRTKVQLLSLYTGKGVFPTGADGTKESGNHAQTVIGYKVVKRNDIVVNIILAWMGALGISEYNGVVSPAYDVYVPNLEKVVPHYFHYVMRTPGIAGECLKYGRGIMMMRWRTYSTEFKKIVVPFPAKDEQQQIADYLDNKCAEIDQTISDKQKQLSLLASYKKSLIYEYVTGKKEVPSA